MRLKVFIGSTLSVVVALSTPALAQEPVPPAEDKPGAGQPPEPPKASPPPSDAPATNDAAGSNAPAATPEPHPATSPGAPGDDASGTPPASAPAGEPIPPTAASAPSADPDADTGKKTVIGERLSPLIVSAAFGYAYASVKYPGLVSTDVTGPFLEIAAGTELNRQFRLLLAFTSIESPIKLTESGWEEGTQQAKVASGLHTTKGPGDPVTLMGGGVEVQRMFHAHSLGPRLDFLPLGAQGPYLGVTTALAIMTGIETQVGANVGARVGGEWRPFQEFSVGIEAGAHGQIYADGNAAIPYATARINLLLDPAGLTSKGRSTPMTTGPMRTLPTPVPR